MRYPELIPNWIEGKLVTNPENIFPKYNPANGDKLSDVSEASETQIQQAMYSGIQGYRQWSITPLQTRVKIIEKIISLVTEKKNELIEIIAIESGKPKKTASGEVDGVIACGTFFIHNIDLFKPEYIASNIPNRTIRLERHPIGLGVLITPFNNPGAGIAWKLFPALISGNAVIIKSHEYTPYTAVWFALICKEAGVPDGVVNVIQGKGNVGARIVSDPKISFISFTGSTAVGSHILKNSADRLAKVCIESGGKNPFVVCDDADIQKAVETAVQASFIDGGQRCAATSRIIVMNEAYDVFKKGFLEKVSTLKVGTDNHCDYGAIISKERFDFILHAVNELQKTGGILLCGGTAEKETGYFIKPTVFEGVDPDSDISHREIFGPIVILYRAKDFKHAIDIANNSHLKLSGAIHTKDMNKAEEFIKKYVSGVVRVNGPTHGSEPHVPFGGVGLSGNGWREPGAKALDFYSDWKQISIDNSI